MGTSFDPLCIEKMQQGLKNICEKLEEHGYESILIAVGENSRWITGSEKGRFFLKEKLLLIKEFVKFCEGLTLLDEFEAETNDSQDTLAPSDDTSENIFEDGTDDYENISGLDIPILNQIDTEMPVKEDLDTQVIGDPGEVSKVQKENNEMNTAIDSPTNSDKSLKTRIRFKNNATKLLEPKVVLTRLKIVNNESINHEKSLTKSVDEKTDCNGEFSCSVCSEEFSNFELLNAHVECHEKLRCCICREEFKSEESLNEHKQIHVEWNEYHECKECKKAFKYSLFLDEHVEKEHSKTAEMKKGNFPCSRCGYVFEFAVHLNEHNQNMPDCKPEVPLEEKRNIMLSSEISFKDQVSGEMKKKTFQELLSNKILPATCEICLKTFNSRDSFRRHVYNHSDVKVFKCFICNKGFSSLDHLNVHKKRHNARLFYCNLCDKRFSTETRREYHIRNACTNRSKGWSNLECTACGHTFASQNTLKTQEFGHMGTVQLSCGQCGEFAVRYVKTKNGEGTYMCEVCGKGFSTERSRRRHMNIHKDGKVACEICSKEFTWKGGLEAHKVQHTGQKPFICEICGKGFHRKCRLLTHTRSHTGEKPYKCDFKGCSKSFRGLDTWRQHKRTHEDNRCFMCDICGRIFKSAKEQNYHRKNHTIDFRWPCDYCEEKYKSLAAYKTHLAKVHPQMKADIEQRTSMRLHQCEICSKVYSTPTDLKRHIFIHKGLKPFNCQYCGKAFNDRDNLRCHEKRLHSEDMRLQCNHCYKRFVYRKALYLHAQKIHGIDKDNVEQDST